jgi:hypothetical protein
MARLYNMPATQSLSVSNTSEVLWQRGGSSPELSQVIFVLTTNSGASWTVLSGTATRLSGTTSDGQLTGLSLPTSGELVAKGLSTVSVKATHLARERVMVA